MTAPARPKGGSPLERFISKLAITDACWLWKGGVDDWGYGTLRWDGRMQKAHRIAWRLMRGEIPRGFKVLHRCDTPCCVRPTHLFLGTNKDNVDDKVRKNRVGTNKLTEAEALEIRRRYATGGISQMALADMFHVSQSAVSKIVLRKNWQPLTVPRGEDNASTTLTNQQIREIRQRLARGERQSALALEFAVSQSSISNIVHRHTWRHLK